MNRIEYKYWLMGALSGLDATQEQIDLIIKEYEKATIEKAPTTVTTTIAPTFDSSPDRYNYFPQGYKPNGDDYCKNGR